jgi:hypothetical protein
VEVLNLTPFQTDVCTPLRFKALAFDWLPEWRYFSANQSNKKARYRPSARRIRDFEEFGGAARI